MSLQLNYQDSELFKEFYGRNTEQMPVLLAENRTHMNTAELMTRRVGVADSDLSDVWFNNYFDTGNGILYSEVKTGKVKPVVNNAQILRTLNPKSNLSKGALILSPEEYKAIESSEFTREQLAKYTERSLRKYEVLDNPLWIALANGDVALLKQYRDVVFAKAKEKYGYDENMGLYLANNQKKPTMRFWTIDCLNFISGANGDSNNLDNRRGRLVGLKSEVQSDAKNLEKIVE